MKISTVQLSSFRRPKSVNYLDGFWLKLFRDILKKLTKAGHTKDFRSLLKGRFSYKLRWEHVVIAFLLGLLIMKSAPTHIIRSQIPALSPAPAIFTAKPLPLLKDVSYKPLNTLDAVYVSKLRPWGTYANSFTPLNCTWGVASRLPVTWNGDANMWAANAAAQGYTVSSVPKVEAIAQTSGDSWAGHVAIVTALNPDGSFVVWEENGTNGLGTVDTRTTTTAEFPNFIYL